MFALTFLSLLLLFTLAAAGTGVVAYWATASVWNWLFGGGQAVEACFSAMGWILAAIGETLSN